MKRKKLGTLLAFILAIGALSGCSQDVPTALVGSAAGDAASSVPAASERSVPESLVSAASEPTVSAALTSEPAASAVSTSEPAASMASISESAVSVASVPESAASIIPVAETVPTAEPAVADEAAAENASQTMQMRVSANGQSILFELNDSSAARSLYEQLPLSIEVENYASNEKIFYPPEKLDTSDTPLLSSGGTGTLGYYAPWGDVILFYDSCGSAGGLYVLGTVVSGAERIESLSGTIQVEAYTA